MAIRKTSLSIAGKQTESSSELATGIGEFFKNRLNLASYIIVGMPKDLSEIAFALEGDDEDLGALLRAILRMAPPGVQRETLKGELRAQYLDAGKYIEDL